MTPTTTSTPVPNLSSVALSGVFVQPGWEPDPVGALKAIAAAGFKRVQIPVWYPCLSPVGTLALPVAPASGTPVTLAGLIQEAHGLGLGVDITLHTDGMGGAYTQLAFVNPAGFASWARAVLGGTAGGDTGVASGTLPEPAQGTSLQTGLQATDTVSWWNELSPLPIGDWAPLAGLYSVLGNNMADIIEAAGAVPVCPMPMSQTPRDVYNAFNGGLNPQLFRGRPRYAVHLYKDDITPEWDLDLQFAWLDAACCLLDNAPFEINEFGGTVPGPSLTNTGVASGTPLEINEFGGTSPGPSLMNTGVASGTPVADVAFYLSVAERCAARGWRHCAWQWPNAGDGLTVAGNSALVAALVGPALA